MNKPAFCLASCASILTLCLASQSSAQVEWAQLADVWATARCDSETYPARAGGTVDIRCADDWRAADDGPICSVGWSGEYTSYLEDQNGPVSPPAGEEPDSFILRLYANNGTQPGSLLAEEAVPSENVHCHFLRTVRSSENYYAHIFNYWATLITPWSVVKGEVYWLSVQAQYDIDPDYYGVQACGWAWDSTEPVTTSQPPWKLLSDARCSNYEGAGWDPILYPASNAYNGKRLNLAFDLFSPAIDIYPLVAPANTPTKVTINAAPPVAAPFTAFVIVTLPSGQIISLVPTSGKASRKEAETTISVPCGIKKGLVPLVRNCPALTEPMQVQLFNNPVALAAGTYDVTAGFFDPAKPITSEKDAYILGTQTLAVQ